MSLHACLAWGQDTSGLDVYSCTTLGIARETPESFQSTAGAGGPG